MKEVKLLKFLGDYVGYNLQDSIHQTRADRLGSINVKFNIFELAMVPMVTYNCDTWMGIGRKTIKILEDFFHFFCRTIFRIGVGCPTTSFYWESAFLKF